MSTLGRCAHIRNPSCFRARIVAQAKYGRCCKQLGLCKFSQQLPVLARAQQSDESARSLQKEIASLMPDPEGSDSLLDPGTSYGNGADWGYYAGDSQSQSRMQNVYDDLLTGSDSFGRAQQQSAAQEYISEEEFLETIESLPAEQRQQELQWRADTLARQEWEAEQALEQAFELQSQQMEASNRYEICMRLADVMDDIEQHDHYSDDGQDNTPSWIRAHFVLESELEAERTGKKLPKPQPTTPEPQRLEPSKPPVSESLFPGVDGANRFLEVNTMDDLLKDVLGTDLAADQGEGWSPLPAEQQEDDAEDEGDEDTTDSSYAAARTAEAADQDTASLSNLLDDVMDSESESSDDEGASTATRGSRV